MGKERFEYVICLVCKSVYRRRIKGMKQRKFKKDTRPYRSLTCSPECSKKYNRTLIKKRNAIKAQWRLKYEQQSNT